MTLSIKSESLIDGGSAMALLGDVTGTLNHYAIEGHNSEMFSFTPFEDASASVICSTTSDAQPFVILSDSLTNPAVASQFRSFEPQFAPGEALAA